CLFSCRYSFFVPLVLVLIPLFFFYSYGDHLYLHSFPTRRSSDLNLAPADLPKESGRFDLPIALGILAATGQIPANKLDQYEWARSEEHTSELQSRENLVCRLLLEKKKKNKKIKKKQSAQETNTTN